MKPEYIIIHCSATKDSGTVSWQAIRRYHMGTLHWSNIGYHFGCELVNNQFEILAGRPLNIAGAHCRAAGMNSRSIGFCVIGSFDYIKPPIEQVTLSAKYVAGLADLLNIPTSKIRGHRHFESKKTCPGKMFDMDGFRKIVDNKRK